MNYADGGDEIWFHLLDDGVTMIFPVGEVLTTCIKWFSQYDNDT